MMCYDYPIEIFDRIAYYLTIKQKGVCQSVCRSWRALFIPSQYRHVQIRGQRQFHQFYQSLAFGIVGHYVKRLSLEDVELSNQELESLPKLCPNLVAFCFQGQDYMNTEYACYSEWKHLRRLTELEGCTITNTVLPGLTHLSVRFQPYSNQSLFDNLYKATELINLSLDSVTLSLAEIELIHQSCPYLQKLRLVNAKLEPIASTTEAKRNVATTCFIEPAKYLTTFEYENGADLYDTYEWFYYISRKYVHLEHLKLWCRYSVDEDPLEHETELEERYGALASIGMNCHQLKSLKLLNVTMNHWIFETLNHVGTQLESVSLGDMADNSIDLLHYISQSQQNITSLTLWGWPSLCIPEIMEETINILGHFNNCLTSLTMSMEFSGISNLLVPVDRLFGQCTNLAYLKLDGAQPSFSDFVTHPKLNHLVIENGAFRNDFFEYLSVCCLDLQALEIHSCTLLTCTNESQLKIHMPLHRFDLISIHHIRPPTRYHHSKKPGDIRFFDVAVLDEHYLYELIDYEPYSPTLTFDYEQKPLESSRPTNYVCHDVDNMIPSTFVSVKCQQLNELNIGSFWLK